MAFVAIVGVVSGFIKADVDSAFRRVPIKPAHRWAFGVAFRVLNTVRSLFVCPI